MQFTFALLCVYGWRRLVRSVAPPISSNQQVDERNGEDVVGDKSTEETFGICARGRNKEG